MEAKHDQQVFSLVSVKSEKDHRLQTEAGVRFIHFGAQGHPTQPCQHQVESPHIGKNVMPSTGKQRSHLVDVDPSSPTEPP